MFCLVARYLYILPVLVVTFFICSCGFCASKAAPIPNFLKEYDNVSHTGKTRSSLKKSNGTGGVASNGEYIVKEPYTEYEEAIRVMYSGSFANAAVIFESVFLQHPSSKIAPNALLMAAFSSYRANKMPDAVMYLDDFIYLYKFNENAPYAHYLKALAYYSTLPYTERDLSSVKEALALFEHVVEFFPRSEYAQESREKVLYLRNMLAQSEAKIGAFYLNFGDFSAALPRFYSILKLYPDTMFVPEALYRLVEAYNALGLTSLAEKYKAILSKDFNHTKWYKLL